MRAALTKSGTGTFTLAAASASVGAVTLSGGVLVGPTGSPFAVAGDWTNNTGTAAFTAGTGTVALGGTSAQAVGGSSSTTFTNLTIANAAGITLGADVRVNGVLTLTSGVITTGARVVYVPTGGSVSRTSGHVNGNLRKFVATGSPSVTFEVGDATSYSPALVAFTNVTASADLTVSATAGNQPQLATSTLDPTRMAHRYWTLSGPGLAFTSYAGTFTFVPGDVDAGANTAGVRRRAVRGRSVVDARRRHPDGDEHAGHRRHVLRRLHRRRARVGRARPLRRDGPRVDDRGIRRERHRHGRRRRRQRRHELHGHDHVLQHGSVCRLLATRLHVRAR